MIAPTIFYQQMKKWVSSDESKPTFQHIYFDGERACASNGGHTLAVVKSFPTQEPHYETVEGARNDNVSPRPPYDMNRVLVSEERQGWRKDIGFNGYAQSKSFLGEWKNAAAVLTKITKGSDYYTILLQKRGARLYAYAVNEVVSAKFVLLDNMEGREAEDDWEAGFNAHYIENIMNFLKATEPLSLSIYTDKHQYPVLTFETEDLILLVSCININREKTKFWRLLKFVDSERPQEPEADEEITDTDMNDILG